MNKLDKVFCKFVIFSLPVLGVAFALSYVFGDVYLRDSQGILGFLNTTLGITVISWILISLYLVIKMIVNQSFRDLTLKKFIKMNDDDERESLISGEAAKISMLSTFAFMTLLLFLSMVTVTTGKIEGERLVKSDKEHFLSIGFDPLVMGASQNRSTDEKAIFTYSGLPVPTSILLLLILSWQLVTFHLMVRRERRIS